MNEKENQTVEICGTTRLPCCHCQPVCEHRIIKDVVLYKQIIIARKDLQMTPGKLSAQVSHGSMAFLTNDIQRKTYRVVNEEKLRAWEYCRVDNPFAKRPFLYRRDDLSRWAKEAFERGEDYFYVKPVNPLDPNGRLELCEPTYRYSCNLTFDCGTYENWIGGQFAKSVLEARNKNHLLKAKTMAENLGMKEGIDFFLIKDNCYTELHPEEDGRTLTVIGFRPMPCEVIDQIGKKYQLYK